MRSSFFRIIALSLLSVSSLAVYAEELPEAEQQKSAMLRRFNLQTSPVGMYFRRFNGSIEAGISRSLSLGVKGTDFPKSTLSGVFNSTTGYEVGGRATWYATSDRFTNGMIFRGGAYYKNTQTRHDLSDALGNALVSMFTLGLASSQTETIDVVDGPAFELMGGYQMVFATGFNVDWNVGLTTYQQYSKVVNLTNGSSEIYESKSWQVRPVVEFNIGYAF